MAVHADDAAHEVDNVVGREGLVLVGLADIFVKGREEEVEKILAQRRLVVDAGQDSSGDEVEDFLKLLLFEFADALRVDDLVLQDDQFLRLVEALVEQRFQFRHNTDADLRGGKTLVGKPLFQGE